MPRKKSAKKQNLSHEGVEMVKSAFMGSMIADMVSERIMTCQRPCCKGSDISEKPESLEDWLFCNFDGQLALSTRETDKLLTERELEFLLGRLRLINSNKR